MVITQEQTPKLSKPREVRRKLTAHCVDVEREHFQQCKLSELAREGSAESAFGVEQELK